MEETLEYETLEDKMSNVIELSFGGDFTPNFDQYDLTYEMELDEPETENYAAKLDQSLYNIAQIPI